MSNTNLTTDTNVTNVINPLESLSAKKPQSARTVNRREMNAKVRADIMNFADVFKYVRAKELFLPNRVSMKHINESETFLTDYFKGITSENLALKLTEKMYLDRLPLLTTDIKSLKCFMTKNQLENFGKKAWQYTNIIDILCKAITMNPQNYKACLELRDKI